MFQIQMPKKVAMLGALLALSLAAIGNPASARSALAQQPAPVPETSVITYNGLRFSYPSWLASGVVIVNAAGDPVDYGPGFADAPHTRVELVDPYPAQGEFDLKGTLKLYSLDNLAKYSFLQAQVTQLQKLLKDRPDLKTFEAVDVTKPGESLPYLPVLTHGQIIRARARYVETDTLQGISYVTVNRADVAPLITSDVYYTFQAISKDGRSYISLSLPFSTTVFPPRLESIDLTVFEKEAQAYFAQAVDKLNKAAANQFRPSLDVLEAITQSINIEQ